MRLSQCIATHDKFFDNTIVNFSADVTLLCGPARCGKSFLMSSLIHALYDKKGQNSAEKDSLVLNITFEDNGSQFRVLRDSTKSVCLRLTGDGSFNREGFCDKEVFASSYIFSPADHHLQSNGVDFQELIPLYLTDNEHYYDKGKLLANILSDKSKYQQIQFVKRESAYVAERARLLKELELRQIKDGKLEKLLAEKEQLNHDISQFAEKRSAIVDSMRELNTLRTMVDEYNEMKVSRIRLVEEKEEEAEKEQNVRNLKRDLKKTFPRFSGISIDVRNSIAKICELYDQMTRLSEKTELFTTKSSAGIRTVIKGEFFVFIASATLLVLNWFQPIIPFFYSLAAAGGFFSLTLILTIARIIHFKRGYAIDQLTKEKNDVEEAITGELAKNNILMEDARGKEIYNFVVHYLNEYGYFCEREEEIREKTGELEILFARNTDGRISELDNKLDDFAKSIKDFSNKTGFTGVNPDSFDYDDYRKELEDQLADTDAESARLQSIIIHLDEEITDFTPSTPDRTDSRLMHVEEQITQARLGIKTLSFLSETIEEIVNKEADNFYRNISSLVLKNLSALGINESLDRIEAFLHGDTFTDNPSLRQLYLIALKVALGECCDRVQFPLIFDEPAVFMDKKTIVLFSDIIKSISQSRQVIILTHDPDQFSFENKVVLR